MPIYEDLVRRAIAAKERTDSSRRDAHEIAELADILRAANAGEVSIRRCAWCDRFRVGDEWLHLEAIGDGQHRIAQSLIATSLLDRATHGICQVCLHKELIASKAAQRRRRKRAAG